MQGLPPRGALPQGEGPPHLHPDWGSPLPTFAPGLIAPAVRRAAPNGAGRGGAERRAHAGATIGHSHRRTLRIGVSGAWSPSRRNRRTECDARNAHGGRHVHVGDGPVHRISGRRSLTVSAMRDTVRPAMARIMPFECEVRHLRELIPPHSAPPRAAGKYTNQRRSRRAAYDSAQCDGVGTANGPTAATSAICRAQRAASKTKRRKTAEPTRCANVKLSSP